MNDRSFELPDAPAIPGLKARGFALDKDCPGLARMCAAMREADRYDYVPDADELFKEFGYEAKKRDLARDVLIVEVDGRIVGDSFVSWDDAPSGERLYQFDANLIPEFRGTGLRRSMLLWAERRAREIASTHPAKVPKLFHVFVDEGEDHWRSLLESNGYRVFRHGFRMVRPNLDGVPELPLPPESKSAGSSPRTAIRYAWRGTRRARTCAGRFRLTTRISRRGPGSRTSTRAFGR
jgi:GNAT superfamily N-acetyltransferase